MASMNFAVIALLVLARVINLSIAQNPYCDITTCDGSANTLCKYSTTTWGETCVSPNAPTLSEADKATIVSLHNDYRRIVAKGLESRGATGPQPAASNMRQLVWDDELASMAQAHAQQCIFEHDSCRDVRRFPVGQNIYISASSTDIVPNDWTAVTKAWSDEVQDMISDYVLSSPENPPSAVGHYTAMVWATTYTVGCGVATYQNSGEFPYNQLYVCNYGPTGNYIDTPVYSQGTAGSNCPPGTSDNDGLCA